MELTGNIIQKGETETFGSNGFRKREIVIKTDEQYPQSILIEFIQDKCDLLNDSYVGQNVTISININGREWTNPEGQVKYFNSIQGWRIQANNQNHPAQSAAQINNTPVNNPVDENDDVPF